VAALLARFPGVRVQLVDADPSRAAIAKALGVGFATPEDALGACDLVVHASATERGLARSLELLTAEGTVLELSWYGDRQVSVPLGEAFHSRRLVIRSSQVGTVSPARPGRTYAARRPGSRRPRHRRIRLRGPAGRAAETRLRRDPRAVPPRPL
jgi:threonine dehydrogenase-like Zn-dependent dehydrogenase